MKKHMLKRRLGLGIHKRKLLSKTARNWITNYCRDKTTSMGSAAENVGKKRPEKTFARSASIVP